MAQIKYEAVLRACNPRSSVTIADVDEAIGEIREALFGDSSHEDISISREDSESFAAAVCHRLGIYLPTRVVIKRMLGGHK